MVRSLAAGFHRLLALSPLCSQAYFALLAMVGPKLNGHRRQQIINSLSTCKWPHTRLQPHAVSVAAGTVITLQPHPGEFDFEAVLGGELSYEREVFAFLDSVLDDYDVVIDIGANVGVFSLFMARRLAVRAKPGVVYAFEPSRLAFHRLLENAALNRVENLSAFNCAIGQNTGFTSFAEPEGHLTNGSLVENFARKFSDNVRTTPVTVLDAALLADLLAGKQRVLIKIDAEGFEATVLEALAPVLKRWEPDLVIEVLEEFEKAIFSVKSLSELRYRTWSITPDGLVGAAEIKGRQWRDWFLSTKRG